MAFLVWLEEVLIEDQLLQQSKAVWLLLLGLLTLLQGLQSSFSGKQSWRMAFQHTKCLPRLQT